MGELKIKLLTEEEREEFERLKEHDKTHEEFVRFCDLREKWSEEELLNMTPEELKEIEEISRRMSIRDRYC